MHPLILTIHLVFSFRYTDAEGGQHYCKTAFISTEVEYKCLIALLVAIKGLYTKTTQLIYIAIKVSMGDEMAVRAHVPMVGEAGMIKKE